ncbi:MAG: thioredoxin-disulfide reductase [Bryobacteraceae bacterium]
MANWDGALPTRSHIPQMRNAVILGSGCAGNTAAIYSARANLQPLVIEGHEPGGQLSVTTEVENFPGFAEGIQGPQLIENMRQQAQRFGAEFKHGRVAEARLQERPFTLILEDGEVVQTRTLIVATGASARWLNLPNEQKLIGHGVSSCATCDGFFFREKEIMVVGGGDSAMEEANFLTRFGRRVALVHRRDAFRATKIMLERARRNPKIEFVTDTVVEDVYDVEKGHVTGVKLRNLITNHVFDRAVDGLFVAIGHVPNTLPFVGQLDLDEDGYIISRGGAKTNIRGVFHAGDVQDRTYRQAVTAAGAGCMAAIEAERFLESEGH